MGQNRWQLERHSSAWRSALAGEIEGEYTQWLLLLDENVSCTSSTQLCKAASLAMTTYMFARAGISLMEY